MNLDTLLRIMVAKSASDMHLKVGCFPHLRINGELVPLGDQDKLDKEDSLMMAFSLMNNKQKEKFRDNNEVDVGYGVRGLGRFRINVFQQRGYVSIAIRAIPTNILAFEDLYLPRVLEVIAREPRGMVLVTGTTGSGKSTTIASMLNYINERTMRHIITIEDPIEFLYQDRMSIVSQREISVDASSFGSALRSALRQDPDVILVGEMRDIETIETALVAAETGHLVFSTLHTNDAASAVTRLIDMGIEPFRIASVVRAIVAQRLVRVLCPECKEAYEPEPEALRDAGIHPARIQGKTVYRGRGCPACAGTGYRGRTGIYETLSVSEPIRQMIMRKADSTTIAQKALEEGMKALRDDGAEKVLAGITTLEELVRVTQE